MALEPTTEKQHPWFVSSLTPLFDDLCHPFLLCFLSSLHRLLNTVNTAFILVTLRFTSHTHAHTNSDPFRVVFYVFSLLSYSSFCIQTRNKLFEFPNGKLPERSVKFLSIYPNMENMESLAGELTEWTLLFYPIVYYIPVDFTLITGTQNNGSGALNNGWEHMGGKSMINTKGLETEENNSLTAQEICGVHLFKGRFFLSDTYFSLPYHKVYALSLYAV